MVNHSVANLSTIYLDLNQRIYIPDPAGIEWQTVLSLVDWQTSLNLTQWLRGKLQFKSMYPKVWVIVRKINWTKQFSLPNCGYGMKLNWSTMYICTIFLSTPEQQEAYVHTMHWFWLEGQSLFGGRQNIIKHHNHLKLHIKPIWSHKNICYSHCSTHNIIIWDVSTILEAYNFTMWEWKVGPLSPQTNQSVHFTPPGGLQDFWNILTSTHHKELGGMCWSHFTWREHQ